MLASASLLEAPKCIVISRRLDAGTSGRREMLVVDENVPAEQGTTALLPLSLTCPFGLRKFFAGLQDTECSVRRNTEHRSSAEMSPSHSANPILSLAQKC